MNDKNNATNEELDCQVTVYDGAYITCDMIEEASNGEEKAQNDDPI